MTREAAHQTHRPGGQGALEHRQRAQKPGTESSGRRVRQLLTMARATSLGSLGNRPPVGMPSTRRVRTALGMTVLNVTPVPASSSLTAALKPTSACLLPT